ncbi:hypothetical protein BDV34DRAFT_94553 [Aspergillus parasiticus]|uniref:Uncharacterized protein n=2 Tax=Aspergillus subgen. Circumdati TaxID=2720871 RepID=A0A5N6DL77_ASPPA|nr:hypothetical protein BDV34DRAFT_94553 [Aspergillus parasiticus]KAE8307699.1 hypothetical protein BDV41DRAFT_34600 [Aspergillus transmontanensis]
MSWQSVSFPSSPSLLFSLAMAMNRLPGRQATGRKVDSLSKYPMGSIVVPRGLFLQVAHRFWLSLSRSVRQNKPFRPCSSSIECQRRWVKGGRPSQPHCHFLTMTTGSGKQSFMAFVLP